MAANMKEITVDSQFQPELTNAGGKLVVVDFYAVCNPTIDLLSLINKSGCECLNEEDDHPLSHALTSKGGYLSSDCDEQLIIFISFNQAVKLHSLKIHGPPDSGPKTVKVFINTTSTLDFDSAENMTPVQQLE
ncbi:hypothetical protein LSH36_25g06032 [Paralvinella palmiformis]|uniref:PITH domain-containing protein n=1 Tax=Paralvinella palmiformis TaxID=53620 RepID=A0AAD9NF35_9ANNE|nr:hypothetical protein LSH36_25g06032 [Paralvinella palmiformis]